MGKFTYDKTFRADFDDRVLAHLQAVMMTKLRRGESFTFTWKDDVSTGSGRTTVWMHPGASVVFTFFGNRAPSLNPEWLRALSYVANSPAGLYVVPEVPARRGTDGTGPGVAAAGQAPLPTG